MIAQLTQKFKASSTLRKIELLAGFFILIMVVFMHLTNLRFGAALIRDEVNTVKLANRPLAAAIHDDLTYDSFPPFSVIVFHFWGLLGSSDLWFRFLGFLIGMAILGVFWLNSRLLKLGVPLLSLAIFEFNYTAVRYGDYVRAYSLGILFLLLTLGFIWKLATDAERSWKTWVFATLTATLCVQTMYQNAFLLCAICAAGAVVAYTHRNWRKIWLIFSVGLVAALSLIPYVGFIRRANDWSVISKLPYDPAAVWQVFNSMLAIPGPVLKLVLLQLVAAGILFFFILPTRKNISVQRKDLFIFSAISLALGSLSLIMFLQRMRVPTQTYYFLPILALAAVFMEAMLVSLVSSSQPQKILKLLLALVFIFLAAKPTAETLTVRTTNIDLVSDWLPAMARKNDLILVNPWLVGISFDRYYKGQTPWLTLPPLGDLSIFRYVLVKEKMAEADPLAPAFASAAKTLSSGGRVWVVGTIGSSVSEKPTVSYMNPYLEYWSGQLAQFMARHGAKRKRIDLQISQTVSSYENFPLTVYQGWRP